MELWASVNKSFILEWPCRQLLFGFPTNGQLPRVSRQSHLSVDIEVKLRHLHSSPDIYLTAEKNPENLSWGTV